MEFYQKLYVGESLDKKQDKIIEKLKAGKIQLGCYVIAVTEHPNSQLEFFDSLLLRQTLYGGEKLLVVGIAGCYEEAVLIVQSILEETYRERRNTDIRTYLLDRWKELEESGE